MMDDQGAKDNLNRFISTPGTIWYAATTAETPVVGSRDLLSS